MRPSVVVGDVDGDGLPVGDHLQEMEPSRGYTWPSSASAFSPTAVRTSREVPSVPYGTTIEARSAPARSRARLGGQPQHLVEVGLGQDRVSHVPDGREPPLAVVACSYSRAFWMATPACAARITSACSSSSVNSMAPCLSVR